MTMNKEKRMKKLSVLIRTLMMFLVSAFMILPFLWMFATSHRAPAESFALPPSFFVTEFKWQNYVDVIQKLNFFDFVKNSFIVSVSALVIQLVVSCFAAYAFSRIEFKFKNILFVILLSGLMIPSQSIIIPNFMTLSRLKLIDTLWSLIVTQTYYPLGIFLLRQFMLTIPKSYDEAAYLDGASKIQVLNHVIIPMSKAPIIVVVFMHFISTWNNFFGPMIFISTNSKMTLPLGLTLLKGNMGATNLSLVMAGVILALIVPLMIYVVGQKHLMGGVMISGIKS